jgi:hypothetical protein
MDQTMARAETTKEAATGTAKERAEQAAGAAGEGAKQVASEAATQARGIAEEATTQAGKLYETSRLELRDQADQRARRAATGLRSWSDQLGALAQGRPDAAGPVVGYVQDAQHRLADYASRIEDRGVDAVFSDLSSFARRRPLVFLGAAGLAGFMIGRVVRGVAQGDGAGSEAPGRASQPAELAPPLGEIPVSANDALGSRR